MFILSSICRGLESWSVNHTSIYEKSESKVFKNIRFLVEIFNKYLKYLIVLYTRLLSLVDNCY